MEKFSEDEERRLDEILSLKVEPYLHGDLPTLELSLEKLTENWLFQTVLALPENVRDELDCIHSDDVPQLEKVHLLNDVLEERQVSSAPKWWELNFFDFDRSALWGFLVEQCSKNFETDDLREYFHLLIGQHEELERARHILRVRKYNKKLFSDDEEQEALRIFDQSYPLDLADYEEAPRRARSPLARLRELFTIELENVGAVGSKKWFEFKILDELAGFELFVHDSARDSELSRRIASQVRGIMYRDLLSLGRMVEHYRWKFSYGHAAQKGLLSAQADLVSGTVFCLGI